MSVAPPSLGRVMVPAILRHLAPWLQTIAVEVKPVYDGSPARARKSGSR